jgi:hypothetical protein
MIVTIVDSNPCINSGKGSAYIIVSGGTPPFTYKWSNGITTDTAHVLDTGVYSCTITDAHGCPGKATVTITQATPLVIDSIVSTPATYPTYTNGTIKVYVSGGIPPGDSAYYIFLWENGPDNDSIYGLPPGVDSVCITSPWGCGSVCDSAFVVTADNEIKNGNTGISIYPVPSRGPLTFTFSGQGFELLNIMDELGNPVYSQSLNSQNNSSTLHIDLSNLDNGLYIARITTKSSVITRKIILQK